MPVLILGVGGTGTEIVREVRSLLDEWHGYVPSHVALGVIDARTDEPQGGRVPEVDFTPNVAVRFVDDFHANRAKGLLDWWPGEVTPLADVDFSSGCGAVRAYGRYFAFRFADSIRITVESMLSRLTALGINRAGGLGSEWRIFVTGSLGNGTCGGSFLDVATVARSIVSRQQPNATVHSTGFFIAGSATRGGNGGRLGDRVGANGYGALLELQYELNRFAGAGGDAIRPRAPRELRTANARWSYSASPDVPPVDGAYLLEGRNLQGKTTDYESLINMAAHSMASLVAGVDEGQRLLDSWVANASPNRLASIGGVSMRVPAKLVKDWLVSTWGAQVVERARSADGATWRGVLADTSADGTTRLLAEEATLDESVDFFLGHVLRMREVGKDGSNDHNQLFDLFAGGDDRLRKDFDRLLGTSSGADDANDAVGLATQIVAWVERNIDGLTAARSRVLLDGPQSRWEQGPPKEGDKGIGGLRWLIDRRAGQFVDAGALGLLRAWTTTLCDELIRNRDSIETHEARAFLGRPQDGALDLQARVAELRAEADSFWARFRRGAVIEAASQVRDEARRKFQFHLWDTKILAVRNLYNRVIGYVRALGAAADQVSRLLEEPRLLGELRSTQDLSANRLDRAHKGQAEAGQGIRPEIPIGGDARGRARLLARMGEGVETSEAMILSSLSSQLRDRFAAALLCLPPADREEPLKAWSRDGVEALDRGAATSADRLRRDLEAELVRRTDPLLRQETRIDALLRVEAGEVVAELENALVNERDAIDANARAQVQRSLEDRAGRVAASAMLRLDFVKDAEAARAQAHKLYLAGRIGQAVAFASPLWSLRWDADAVPTPSAFVVYPSSAPVIGEALTWFNEKFAAGGVQGAIQAHGSTAIDPRMLYIAQAQVGAGLFDLNMHAEHELYEQVSTREAQYSPHTTRDYASAAQRMLHVAGAASDFAAVLLPLALSQHLLDADRTGNYRVARDIPGDPATGRRAFTPGPVGRRGEAAFLEWLNEPTREAGDLRDGIRTLVWEPLLRQGLASGWEAPAAALQLLAANALRRTAGLHDAALVEAIERQAKALEALARELIVLRGAEVPSTLRLGAG